MGYAFSLVLAKIAGAVGWFGLLFVAVFVAFWDVVKDAFSWLFEQVMAVAVSGLSSFDATGISSYAASAGTLPADILNILGLLHVGAAISIISAAIVIRLGLQLIPFVRLGS
jgi:hypothetical protein